MRASCSGETIAPMSVDLSKGSPTRSVAMRALSFLSKAPVTLSATNSREPAQQTCP